MQCHFNNGIVCCIYCLIMRNIVIFTFILVLGACSSRRESAFDDFADEKEFEVSKIEIEPCRLDVEPLCPFSCCIFDSLLVVFESPSMIKSNFVKFYHNEKLISEFGQIGNGPKDFVSPTLASRGKVQSGALYISDLSGYCELSFSPGSKDINLRHLPVPDGFDLVNNVLSYSDSAIIAAQTGEYQLHCFNTRCNTIAGFNYFDKSGSLSDVPDFCLAMEMYKSASSANDKFAVLAYNNLKIIDIVSIPDMTLYKRLHFKDFDCNSFRIGKGGDIYFDSCSKIFFTYVAAYKDSFYALCWDSSENELMKGASCKIYQIDYEGNVLRQYLFDNAISSFTICNDEIWAIVFDYGKQEKIICKGTLQ